MMDPRLTFKVLSFDEPDDEISGRSMVHNPGVAGVDGRKIGHRLELGLGDRHGSVARFLGGHELETTADPADWIAQGDALGAGNDATGCWRQGPVCR